MSKLKLNSIVEKQISASTEFWAGKPKLSIEELSAVEAFAKKKGEVFESFFSHDGNLNKLNDMFKTASLKK